MGTLLTHRGFIEDTCRISIRQLRDWGYLCEGSPKGVVTMRRRGWAAEVGIEVCLYPLQSFFLVIFCYQSNGKRTFDWFRLERQSLTWGYRYYFRCRETKRLVTALYFANGYFASRYAHGLAYRVCGEHRRWDENARRYYKFKAKVDGLDRVTTRTSNYWKKSEKYLNMMAEDFDRRFSKVLDRIHRNDGAMKNPSAQKDVVESRAQR